MLRFVTALQVEKFANEVQVFHKSKGQVQLAHTPLTGTEICRVTEVILSTFFVPPNILFFTWKRCSGAD
jgi:hypothetical protein